MNQIQELFALPIGLKSAGNIAGIPLYTSELLKEKYIESMTNTTLTKNIASSMTTLVKDGRIVPCYASSGMITFLIKRIDINAKRYLPLLSHVLGSSMRSLGMYQASDKKLYVIIDNSGEMAGDLGNREIARISVHELIHMSAHENTPKFLPLFYDELGKFYSSLLSNLFSLENVPINKFKEFSKFIFVNFEKGGMIKFSELYKKLQSFIVYSSLTELEFRDRCMKYMSAIRLMLTDLESFYDQSSNQLKVIQINIEKAYKHAFSGTTKDILYGQELIFPSEVIAVSSEINVTPKISTAVRSIL